MKLESYVEGAWRKGSGVGRDFIDPTSGAVLGQVDATGIDAEAALSYARKTGGASLAALTFAERGGLLRGIADCLTANREAYVEIARKNSGNTALDAAIDIDGAIGTLKVYARYAKGLGEARSILEPDSEQLAREDVFRAQHIWTTRPGVALHINAFNFPSWGLWEKVAVALLAGVPSVAKPASATAWLSHQMVRDVVAAGLLPEGALSLVCGTGEELLEALRPFDHLAFTGSSDTALSLRAHPRAMSAAPRITIEADSVNATLLGPEAKPGDAVFDLLVREVAKALMVKAGQLCTNIRRVLVAAETLPALQEAIAAKLAGTVIGDPADEAVRMGPLVNKRQQAAALSGLNQLAGETDVVCGGDLPEKLQGGSRDKGCFLAPTLLSCADPDAAKAVFETEVFGPAATLIPYRDEAHALALVQRSGGSLVASLFSNDAAFAKRAALALAPYHGRLLVVDETVGKNHTGHAIVVPQCVHGGPGRAGNGEELGGLRGLSFYMQRSAIQGSPALLQALEAESASASL
jgi:3,4-dehydroadipyl-CoA semialdehyde dehydrogenase